MIEDHVKFLKEYCDCLDWERIETQTLLAFSLIQDDHWSDYSTSFHAGDPHKLEEPRSNTELFLGQLTISDLRNPDTVRKMLAIRRESIQSQVPKNCRIRISVKSSGLPKERLDHRHPPNQEFGKKDLGDLDSLAELIWMESRSVWSNLQVHFLLDRCFYLEAQANLFLIQDHYDTMWKLKDSVSGYGWLKCEWDLRERSAGLASRLLKQQSDENKKVYEAAMHSLVARYTFNDDLFFCDMALEDLRWRDFISQFGFLKDAWKILERSRRNTMVLYDNLANEGHACFFALRGMQLFEMGLIRTFASLPEEPKGFSASILADVRHLSPSNPYRKGLDAFLEIEKSMGTGFVSFMTPRILSWPLVPFSLRVPLTWLKWTVEELPRIKPDNRLLLLCEAASKFGNFAPGKLLDIHSVLDEELFGVHTFVKRMYDKELSYADPT